MDEEYRPQTQTSTQVPPPPRPPAPPQVSDLGPDGRPYRHPGRGVALAIVIILIGVIFLLKNTGWLGSDWSFDNWWGLFILLPTFGFYAGAVRAYRENGRRINGAVVRGVIIGTVLLAVTAIFVLELDWGKAWPVLLIIVGLGLILGWRRN